MESEGTQSSDVASEMSQLMDCAVSASQQKELEKKTKAKEAKIRRQLKKMKQGNPEAGGQQDESSDGTKWFQSGELSIMINHLDSNYNLLFGNCKKASYKQQRVKAWQALMDALNIWNEQSETQVVRDMDSVKRKIDNLKQRGN